MQARQKWLTSTPSFKVGDCVAVKDQTLKREDIPSLRVWSLAVIEKIYPGKDGHVRVIDLHCNNRLYNRDLSKQVKLFTPQVDDESSSLMGEDVRNST